MSFEIQGPKHDLHFSMFDWPRLLGLANDHGWEPAGIVHAETGEPLGMGYFTSDGQKITDEDARNLADALERALADLPEENLMTPYLVSTPMPGGGVIRSINVPVERLGDIDLRTWWSGPKREKVKAAIALFREGSVEIR